MIDADDQRWLEQFHPPRDSGFDFEGELPIPQNVVSTMRSRGPIDTLRLIGTFGMPSCKKSEFAATTLRLKSFGRRSGVTVQMFDTGKCVIMGIPTLAESKYWAHVLRLRMDRLGLGRMHSKLTIKNVVASGHTRYNIELGEFTRRDKIGSVNQQESFPGVPYYFQPAGRKKIRTLLFESGKLIYMGARHGDNEQIRIDFRYIYPILEEYKSKRVNKDDLIKCRVGGLVDVLRKAIPDLPSRHPGNDAQALRARREAVQQIVFNSMHVASEPHGIQKLIKRSERNDVRSGRPTKRRRAEIEHGFVDRPELSLFDIGGDAAREQPQEPAAKRQRRAPCRRLEAELEALEQLDRRLQQSAYSASVQRERERLRMHRALLKLAAPTHAHLGDSALHLDMGSAQLSPFELYRSVSWMSLAGDRLRESALRNVVSLDLSENSLGAGTGAGGKKARSRAAGSASADEGETVSASLSVILERVRHLQVLDISHNRGMRPSVLDTLRSKSKLRALIAVESFDFSSARGDAMRALASLASAPLPSLVYADFDGCRVTRLSRGGNVVNAAQIQTLTEALRANRTLEFFRVGGEEERRTESVARLQRCPPASDTK